MDRNRFDFICYHKRNFVWHNKDRCVRIPMLSEIRSLNLSNSVAVVLYEALRQNDFSQMQLMGHLTKFDDYIE